MCSSNSINYETKLGVHMRYLLLFLGIFLIPPSIHSADKATFDVKQIQLGMGFNEVKDLFPKLVIKENIFEYGYGYDVYIAGHGKDFNECKKLHKEFCLVLRLDHNKKVFHIYLEQYFDPSIASTLVKNNFEEELLVQLEAKYGKASQVYDKRGYFGACWFECVSGNKSPGFSRKVSADTTILKAVVGRNPRKATKFLVVEAVSGKLYRENSDFVKKRRKEMKEKNNQNVKKELEKLKL